MSLTVNKDRCPENHRCPAITVCPYSALIQNGNLAPEVISEKCVECGKCVNFCPMNALTL